MTARPTILAASFLLLSLCACREDPRGSPLAEGWQYRWGDSAREGDLRPWAVEAWDAPGWIPLTLPAQPEEGMPDGATFVWMRVRLPAIEDPSTRLFLKYVDQNVEAWLDGRPVYRFGDLDAPDVRMGRPYHLVPLGTGPAGRILSLRVRSEHHTRGIFGVPWVGTEAALQRHILRESFWGFSVGILLVAAGLAILATFLVVARHDRRLLTLSLFALSSGTYCAMSVYSPMKQLYFEAPELLWYVELVAVYVAPACYFAFYETIAEQAHRRWVRLIWLALAAFTALALAGALAGLFTISATLKHFHNLLTAAIVIGLFLTARSAWRGSVEARVFLAGMLSVAVAGLHDTLVDERILAQEAAWIVWGFLLFVVFLSIYMVMLYARQLRERNALAGQIAQRNDELTRARERIVQAAGQLSDQASQILEAASRQAATAADQAAANHQTSATVSQIAQMSREAARSAGTVVKTAGRSVDLHQQGEKAVAEAVAAMEDLSRQVAAIAATVSQLSERADQIGGITDASQELAEQSNLLALNAAIESARAGEHGLGFGVVAQQMQALAEQSKAGSAKVRALLAEVQAGIAAAVEATEQGTRNAQRVLELAREAGAAISSLATVIEDSSRVARQIASSAQEQTRGVEQIVSAITDSSGALDDALAGTRRIEEVARTLSTLSSQLAALSRGDEGQATDRPGPAS